jgi:hypothetical protein
VYSCTTILPVASERIEIWGSWKKKQRIVHTSPNKCPSVKESTGKKKPDALREDMANARNRHGGCTWQCQQLGIEVNRELVS